ncbi:MAG: Gldg family protein [Bacteroidales bacterium]|nr:Gldg family protein [Bacteroidales bacterium]
MKNKKSLTYYLLLIAGVIILINILSDKLFVRLDFTADKTYTLSKATKNILKNLSEPVTITAYFTKDLPPQIAQTRRDFKDMLIEYGNISKGKLVYEFVNPNKDKKTEQEAMQAGIQPVIINVREKDQVKQQKVYLGAVIRMGEDAEPIPFMKPGAAMEYALSSGIKKLSVINKPVVGLLQGHGEPSIQALQQAMSSLSVLYDVKPFSITDTSDLSRYITIAIIAPKDSFPQMHLNKLDDYLANKGNLFIAYNRVDGDLSSNPPMGKTHTTGLEDWLSKKGLTIENNFVVDAKCASVGVRQQQGFFNFTTNVSFPYIPIITNFADHPITKGIENVIFKFASSIDFTGDTSLNFVPLAMTSEKSGTQNPPLYFDINKKWTNASFPLSKLNVAALLEGKIVGNNQSRIILVGDGDFPVNGEGQNAKQIQADNVNLMVNSIDWLSDDTGLIDLRTKGVTSRPLDQISDTKKNILRWVNFLLPIIIVLIYAIFRAQKRKNLKIKRMEESYV